MLKERVRKLQALTATYIPVKGDEVDECLAQFINNYEDKSKLQVMFIRLSPGIYSFGSKKVCIKVDNGRITIRVGGGYLRIDEFLDHYTTTELEKSIREGIDPMSGAKSPIRRGNSPKKLLQKVQELDRKLPTDKSPLPKNLDKSVEFEQSPSISPSKKRRSLK